METLPSYLEPLLALLQEYPLPLDSEKATQRSLEDALTAEGIPFIREHSLSKRDIVDFMVGEGEGRIALEVKKKGSRIKSTYRQLERYAEHDDVSVIVLLTGTAMGLPAEINGKPAFVQSLGQAWL